MQKKMYSKILSVFLSLLTTHLIMPASMNESEITVFNEQADEVTQQAVTFWQTFELPLLTILDNPHAFIDVDTEESFTIALDLGFQLANYNRLEIFATQYNALSTATNQLFTILQENLNLQEDPSDQSITDQENFMAFQKFQTQAQLLLSMLENHQIKLTQQRQQSIATAIDTTNNQFSSISNFVDHARRLSPARNFGTDGYRYTSAILGDGNCGYRAFLTSAYINSIEYQNYDAVQSLKNLVRQQFTPIFKSFAQGTSRTRFHIKRPFLRTYQYIQLTDEEIEHIKIAMLNTLDQIQNLSSNRELLPILNNNPAFDFYMIMFIRGLIMQYMIEHPEELMIATITAAAAATKEMSEEEYLQYLAEWTTWIDSPELAVLNRITGITIRIINHEAAMNRATVYQESEIAVGHADLLFVNGNHYDTVHQSKTNLLQA